MSLSGETISKRIACVFSFYFNPNVKWLNNTASYFFEDLSSIASIDSFTAKIKLVYGP